jgi:hypothetical protein
MRALLLHVVERRQVGLDLHDLEVAVGDRLVDLRQLQARSLGGKRRADNRVRLSARDLTSTTPTDRMAQVLLDLGLDLQGKLAHELLAALLVRRLIPEPLVPRLGLVCRESVTRGENVTRLQRPDSVGSLRIWSSWALRFWCSLMTFIRCRSSDFFFARVARSGRVQVRPAGKGGRGGQAEDAHARVRAQPSREAARPHASRARGSTAAARRYRS